jgi:hypothetical protein
VVAAVGLSIGDLFVKRELMDLTPAARASLREHARQAQWRTALNVTGFEAKIVLAAAGSILKNEPLSGEDSRRLHEAVNRIDNARGVLCVRSY